MKSYTYQLPLSKTSTAIIYIHNNKGEVVGSFKRYYKSILHQIFDLWIGENRLICNVSGFNQKDILVLKAYKKNNAFKRSVHFIEYKNGESEGSVYKAHHTGFDIIKPEYIIEGNNIQLNTKFNTSNLVEFYEEGTRVARWRCAAKEKYKTYIEIEENAKIQDPIFYGVYCYMFFFLGEY